MVGFSRSSLSAHHRRIVTWRGERGMWSSSRLGPMSFARENGWRFVGQRPLCRYRRSRGRGEIVAWPCPSNSRPHLFSFSRGGWCLRWTVRSSKGNVPFWFAPRSHRDGPERKSWPLQFQLNEGGTSWSLFALPRSRWLVSKSDRVRGREGGRWRTWGPWRSHSAFQSCTCQPSGHWPTARRSDMLLRLFGRRQLQLPSTRWTGNSFHCNGSSCPWATYPDTPQQKGGSRRTRRQGSCEWKRKINSRRTKREKSTESMGGMK